MEYLLKASAVIILMYLCFYVFLKKETFFEHNRWFLLTGLLLALVFPLIVIPIYVPIEPIITQTTTFIPSTSSGFVAAQPSTSFDWYSLIPILYGIGLVVFSIQFVFQFSSLVSLLLKNPKRKDQHFTYVIVNHNISPFSFFKWIIYNPETYENKELQLILTHEKVHVNQLHSIDILLTQLACVVFWFNPLIWLYRKEVRQNLEYIADFKSQNSSHSKKDYQHLLLKTSIANHHSILSNNFYNSSIKKRILMLNKSRSNKKNQWKYVFVLPLLAGLMMSMNSETVYVETQTNDSKQINTLQSKETSAAKQDSITSETIKVKFTKNSTDKSIDKIKTWLKSKNVTMTIKRLKRNSQNEISNINIDFKTPNGTANYSVKDTEGINPFEFKVTDDGNFSVGAIQDDNHIKTMLIVEEIHNQSQSGQKQAIDQDSIVVIVEDSTYIKTQTSKNNTFFKKMKTTKNAQDSIYFSIDSSEVKRLTNETSDFYYEDGSQPEIISEDIIIYDATNKKTFSTQNNYFQNPKPLVLFNGKEVSSDYLKSISPENIESVTVLKDEKAIHKYGEKGKNGVIELTTKENVVITKKDNLEQITRSEITSVTFIDDEDASKNASIAYISKYTTDEVLDNHKMNLKNNGITVKYSKLKRNKAGEITSIKISLDDKDGSKASATWKVNDGIPNIEYGKSDGALIARTKQP
ncbi:hypothetical protein ITJ86_00400 [Winogradskyella sp. F6397]|uniref:Peptidase M56 domain-containing protein n=1 Tax=Winogradskyella marina TaxID=2785530 RepID=A0ABS0ED18_9FLAO|nr:M56 family metallopeptidase [Winogradskyella marina]MBF8148334.1 hypothetical protein [Winogradskyella marina]